jgi:ceramide glucosyltransferase
MWTVLTCLLLGATGISLLLQALGVRASVRTRRARTADTDRHLEWQGPWPAVSLLKPLKGVEESLEANLRTFFELRYDGPLEVVFATAERDDPALPIAHRVAAEYPSIRTRFVISDPNFGLNPKVANLAGALAVASHGLVWQSDANVRVRPDYLARVVAELEQADASLLSSLIAGVGERSSGAAMENLQLNAFTAPAVCTALDVAGTHCVIGKSMLLRRADLEEAGGLELVRDVLAEDFVLGREFQRLGKKIVLSRTTVENVNEAIGIDTFLARHSRWLKMRAAIHVGGFIADLGANPIALVSFAVLASGLDLRVLGLLCGVTVVKMGLDAFHIRSVRGYPMRWHHLALGPVKDFTMGIVWLHATCSRSVRWRGSRLRFGRDSVLRPDVGRLPVRVLRRMLSGAR